MKFPNTVRKYIQVGRKRVKSHELQKENIIPVLRLLSRMDFFEDFREDQD